MSMISEKGVAESFASAWTPSSTRYILKYDKTLSNFAILEGFRGDDPLRLPAPERGLTTASGSQ